MKEYSEKEIITLIVDIKEMLLKNNLKQQMVYVK